MSGKKFVLSWVEHEKSFITLGPGLAHFFCFDFKSVQNFKKKALRSLYGQWFLIAVAYTWVMFNADTVSFGAGFSHHFEA